MAGNAKKTVIYISARDKAVHWYSSDDGRIIHDTRDFKSVAFDDEFYKSFTAALGDFAGKYTPATSADTAVVLPDSAVFTDTLNFPAMKKPALKSALNTSISGAYKNFDELKINAFQAVSNKQNCSFCVVGVRKDLLARLKKACTDAKIVAQTFSFAANTAVNAVGSLNGKLRSANYMLLDMKESLTRVVCVIKGHAVAFGALPFGFSVLDERKIAAEDLLLYQPVADLAVLNARERAKAKALTMMGAENTDAVLRAGQDEDDDSSFSGADAVSSTRTVNTIKTLPRKTARKLPKFMLREPPEAGEDTVCENFRLFVKWALTFKEGNPMLAALAKPAAVYVNMPQEFGFVFDKVNAEEEENGIKFLSAGLEKQKDEVARNLELFGGFYANRMNQENNF